MNINIGEKKIQVCSNCVMDTTDPKISFDVNGRCDHCNTFYSHTVPNWKTGVAAQKSLNTMIERIKKEGSGNEFDCILGLSGGVDSSYLAYLAVKKFGLRPLLFHVDAGWNSHEAVNNISALVDHLNVDLFTEVIDWVEMRDLQLAYFKAGVPHIDTPQDHAFFSTMYAFAKKYNIKNILTGGNLSTECVRNPIDWMYFQSDKRQLLDIHEKFGTVKLTNFPTTTVIEHKIIFPLVKNIKVLRPLDLVRYRKDEAIRTLTSELGWLPYAQKHFESRFTKFYEGYWLPRKFGFDTRKVQFSSLILTGQMSREKALDLLSSNPLTEKEERVEKAFVADKLGILESELDSYFNQPNKTYTDFKSSRHLYKLGARVFKLLGREVGGKR